MLNRRQLLTFSLGACAGAAASTIPGCGHWGASSSSPASGPVAREGRKVIVVLFGGGTRSSESIDDPNHRFIPRLWNEMIPRGTLLDNIRVQGRIVHSNCTAGALTGHVEYADNDWTRPVAHPTIFEIYRKVRKAEDTSAWFMVYASILAAAGCSSNDDFGSRYAANVIEPPTIPRSTAEEMDRLLREAAATGSPEAELRAAGEAARVARSTSRIHRGGLRSDMARGLLDQQYDAWKRSEGTTSHDTFLADCAVGAMRRFSPGVLVVAFGEIDCAHYGSWSRYVQAIRRTDELTWRLWRTTEELDAYRGQTLMLVLPDHGRQLESTSPGFIHHSDFETGRDEDEGCRRVWMLALGPGIAAGRRVATAIPHTAVAATALDYLGLPASAGAAGSVMGVIGS